jgi:hypothetical protein
MSWPKESHKEIRHSYTECPTVRENGGGERLQEVSQEHGKQALLDDETGLCLVIIPRELQMPRQHTQP